jgi:hypothetical protein
MADLTSANWAEKVKNIYGWSDWLLIVYQKIFNHLNQGGTTNEQQGIYHPLY